MRGVAPTRCDQWLLTVQFPYVLERRANDGLAVAPPPRLGMSDDVLKECVALPATQQVWRGDEHVGGNDPPSVIHHEDMGVRAGQNLVQIRGFSLPIAPV